MIESRLVATIAAIAALFGGAMGVGGTLLLAERGPAGPQGEQGPEGLPAEEADLTDVEARLDQLEVDLDSVDSFAVDVDDRVSKLETDVESLCFEITVC